MVEPSPLLAELERCWSLNCAGQAEDALAAALLVRERAAEQGDQAVLAKASLYVGWFMRHVGRPSDGIDFVQEARRIWTHLANQHEQARSGAIFAWLLLELGDDEEAAAEAAEAFALAEALDSESLTAFVGDIHSITLNQTGDYPAALAVSQRSLSLARSFCDPCELAGHLIDRGYIFTCQADSCLDSGHVDGANEALAKALACNNEAITVARQVGDSWKLRIALSNGADIYTKARDFASAEACLAEWADVPGEARGRLLREYDYAACALLIAKGELDEARLIYERSVQDTISNGIPLQELNAVKKLSELCEMTGDYQSALTYFRIYHGAYKKISGDAAKRRVRLTALRKEIEDLKSNIAHVELLAQELATEAARDSLTGTANRRTFDRELARLVKLRIPVTLALLDLDHFKHINDGYSHLVGDDVLRIVGDQLMKTCKTGQVAARFGGEEFALILPDTGLNEAEEICERFRTGLASRSWEQIANGLRVTVSIGIASSNEAEGVRGLVELADGRLYAAKIAGRDCVICGTEARSRQSH